MVKKILPWIIVAAFLIGAYFVLRTRFLWLDYFTGEVVDKIEDTVATVESTQTRSLSIYFLKIDTSDGRQLTVPVEQVQYFRSRPGMRVEKQPFSLVVHLSESFTAE